MTATSPGLQLSKPQTQGYLSRWASIRYLCQARPPAPRWASYVQLLVSSFLVETYAPGRLPLQRESSAEVRARAAPGFANPPIYPHIYRPLS